MLSAEGRAWIEATEYYRKLLDPVRVCDGVVDPVRRVGIARAYSGPAVRDGQCVDEAHLCWVAVCVLHVDRVARHILRNHGDWGTSTTNI